ncbi:MAG: hypothetical protein ISS57_15825 [Anaerolineales bacterium]|nr:hypothetical protein [Anaerolineales bacterium]
MKTPVTNIFATCEYVTMGMGERPTVVDVFNNIHFAQLPGTHNFTLFARLLAEPGTYPITIQAGREGGEKSIDVFSADITVGESHAHNILVKEDFSFDHPGQYTFSITSAGQTLGETYLAITNDAPQAEQAHPDES